MYVKNKKYPLFVLYYKVKSVRVDACVCVCVACELIINRYLQKDYYIMLLRNFVFIFILYTSLCIFDFL